MRVLVAFFMPALLNQFVSIASGCSTQCRKLHILTALHRVQHSCVQGSVASKAGKTIRATQPRASTINAASSSSAGRSTLATAALASMAAPIVIKPKGLHNSTVIMLHGLGDTGDGWASIGEMFSPALRNTKFIFPTSPVRPITLNMGMTMTGWHDIVSLDKLDVEEDSAGLKDSMQLIEKLAQSEHDAGIKKIVVAGFSQGGTIALLMLRSQLKLAGVVGLSTYLSLRNEKLLGAANSDTPVLLAHGTADQVVKYKFGELTAAKLKEAGVKLKFESYPGMGHEARPEELQLVQSFLQQTFKD